MTLSLEEILAEAAKQVEADKAAEQALGVTKADLGIVLGQFKTSLLEEVKVSVGEAFDEVKKAIPTAEPTQSTPQRLEGVGRKGQVEPSTTLTADPREEDPLTYIIEKASKAEDNTVFDETDYALLNAIIYQALVGDLKY